MYTAMLVVTLLLGPGEIERTTQRFETLAECEVARIVITKVYNEQIVPLIRRQRGLRPYIIAECTPARHAI